MCTEWLQSNLPSQPLCVEKKMEVGQIQVFFKMYIYLMCIDVLPAGLAYEGIGSPEVELQRAVSFCMGAGNWTWVIWKNS